MGDLLTPLSQGTDRNSKLVLHLFCNCFLLLLFLNDVKFKRLLLGFNAEIILTWTVHHVFIFKVLYNGVHITLAGSLAASQTFNTAH